MKYKRIFLIVTDGLGAGEEPKSWKFGDHGANTFAHIAKKHDLNIPTWLSLGINKIVEIPKYKGTFPLGRVFKVQEISNAKDTLAGHWEMMGIETKQPFASFTNNGFPLALIKALSRKCDGRTIIGNKAASGTEILKELAHLEGDDKLIVYTSGDSVLQICGNEETMGIDKLYEYCSAARSICSAKPEWNVGRIIARPYIQNSDGTYTRTANRHDYSVTPPEATLLNKLSDAGILTIGVGKIHDIFSGSGIRKSYHSESDNNGMDITIDLATKITDPALIFVNLVDFDAKWGHRRDVEGYAKGLENFDTKLSKLINAMTIGDLLIITSDHGNDPTMPGSDHTREYLPVTTYSPGFNSGKVLPTKLGLGTVGNIIARNFELDLINTGEDVFDEITED